MDGISEVSSKAATELQKDDGDESGDGDVGDVTSFDGGCKGNGLR